MIFIFCINKNKIHRPTTFRYEIEYDETRYEIGKDIGKRFLGIEYEGEGVIDSGGGGGGGVRHDEGGGGGYSIDRDEHIGHHPDCNDGTVDGINTKNGIDSNDDEDDDDNETIENKENISSKEFHFINEKDELVLDILNDDLIAKVRGKITRKCVKIIIFLI